MTGGEAKSGNSDEQAVRAELDRVLQSAEFRSSKRCSDFLAYVVEHTITGPIGALKERLIGVEVFQLPPDFDPGQHAIVRVTATEVRKRLAQHYLASNGSRGPVRIDLPPGSYKAEFRRDTPAAEMAPPVRRETRTARIVGIAAAVVLLLAGGLAGWRWRTSIAASPDARSTALLTLGPIPKAAPQAEDLRILVGAVRPYTDRSGHTWSPDRFFTGGLVRTHASAKIFRTLDPDIYRRQREGDFRYDIPLQPGSYELHLHFAETGLPDLSVGSSGEGERLFRVDVNGQRILDQFDVVADADGVNVADERVIRNVAPAADGLLHLSFPPMRGTAVLSGIEALAVSPGTVRPVRIRAGFPSSWRDGAGQQWDADAYFMGGNALVRSPNPARESGSNPTDLELYASERWGHFSYTVPVAEGRYRLTLRFCEGHYGSRNSGIGGVGSRVFDVYCNGVALLRNFDIFKQAGGEGKPIERTFSGIQPTAQGKIVLSFVPIVGMACVNGIEVAEERK